MADLPDASPDDSQAPTGDMAAVARAVGAGLRTVREGAGWSRADLAGSLSDEVHPQTLASYERGVRQPTVGRFVEISPTLGVPAGALLGSSLQRAGLDLASIHVDLYAVLASKEPGLRPLRRWARARLEADPDGYGIARLNPEAVAQLATLFDLPRDELVQQLIQFTPSPLPRPGRAIPPLAPAD